jgi:hypothetical protein
VYFCQRNRGFLHLFAAEKNCFTPLVAKRFHPLFDIELMTRKKQLTSDFFSGK